MKKVILFLTLTLFNVIIGGMISVATGLNPLAVIGGGALLSAGIGNFSGVAPMAIQKEIWFTTLTENLFADNTFMSKAVNADEFVQNGKTVHIPGAGAPSGTKKNRTSFPATVTTRNDVDVTFDLDEYTTDPRRIANADKYELSYNKRESIMKEDKASLMEYVANDFTYRWSTTTAGMQLRTSGTSAVAHVTGATGNRKKLVSDDVLAAMNLFNTLEIPQAGRYMLCDAIMYGQLLASLTAAQTSDFNKQADMAKGVLGQLWSFNIMMRSKAARYTSALVPKDWDPVTVAATTDQAAAIFWQDSYTCRALGQTEAFDDQGNPLYYGDIISFLVRAGGRIMRSDSKGVGAIIQDNA